MKFLQILFLMVMLCVIFSCEEEEGPVQVPAQEWTYAGLGNQAVVEVETGGEWVYAATQAGMYKKSISSNDTLWTSAGLTGKEITDFIIKGNGQLLASVNLSSDNPSATLYETFDGGNQWTPLQSNFGGQQGAISCQALEVDPNNQDIVFGRGHYNVAKSTDGGANWSSVFADWDNTGYQADLIQVYDENSKVVWAGGETSIFSPYMINSTDGGQKWQAIQVPSQGDNAVYAMVIHPDDPQQLLVGMEGQIISSQNGGADWETVLSPDNYSYFLDMQLSLEDENQLYATATDGGNDLGDIIIYTSDDFGEAWDNSRYSGQEGKEYAARDLGLYTSSDQEAMYVATNHGVFVYAP